MNTATMIKEAKANNNIFSFGKVICKVINGKMRFYRYEYTNQTQWIISRRTAEDMLITSN